VHPKSTSRVAHPGGKALKGSRLSVSRWLTHKSDRGVPTDEHGEGEGETRGVGSVQVETRRGPRCQAETPSDTGASGGRGRGAQDSRLERT